MKAHIKRGLSFLLLFVMIVSICETSSLAAGRQHNTQPANAYHAFCAHRWRVIKTKRPTVLEKGWRIYRCSKCGSHKRVSLAKLKPYIRLSTKSICLKTGKKSCALKVTAMQKGDRVASFHSSNRKVVAVGRNSGILTGRKIGKAKITVTLKSGKKATCAVTVRR